VLSKGFDAVPAFDLPKYLQTNMNCRIESNDAKHQINCNVKMGKHSQNKYSPFDRTKKNNHSNCNSKE